ncbi:hypothetical protein CR513_32566, partial [Mucuna pruriens]
MAVDKRSVVVTWKEIPIIVFESYDSSQPGPPIFNPCGIGVDNSKPATLSMLTQHYDPPLKCFTFRDFQLAPILEEYERLIGIPYDKSPPYLFRGHYPSWASVARVLKAEEKSKWSGSDPRSGLGTKAPTASGGIRLVSLGIMLFPQIERYVDLATIDAFLGRRDRGEHIVVRRLKEQANKHLEMAARVEEAAREVQEEARFWKDRFIKLA